MPTFLERPFTLEIVDNVITCENVETGEINKKELNKNTIYHLLNSQG